MSSFAIIMYSVAVVLLVLLSAFFSCSETGLMAINRYRLRHEARQKKQWAMLILRLLRRPDRLLGTILIGNTVANIAASSIATLIALQLFGDFGVVIMTVLLTIVILIFSEVTPKTLAAINPERVSRIVAWPINVLQKIMYPVVWLINTFANGLLKLMSVNVGHQSIEPLSREELRTVVFEATGKVPHQYQSMLLGILDLNKVTVEDVMIPRHQIVGIDLDQPWEKIQAALSKCKFEWIPIYKENIDQVNGILHVRDLIGPAIAKPLTQDILVKNLQEPYFIPEGTLLNIQLQNFQQNKQRTALVVDEYGEIKGLVTLKDILVEIVGEFTSNVTVVNQMIQSQQDGSYLVDGGVTIRELNRLTHWHLPTGGPRTLNGLIVEYLETIPRVGICVQIGDYPMEILDVKENRVKSAKLYPPRSF